MAQYLRWQSVAEMIRRVGSARGRQLTGLYSIEGTRLVERALRAGAPLEAVLVAERPATAADPRQTALLAALRATACPVITAPDTIVTELTEGRDLGPFLGLVRLPPPVTLSDLLSPLPPHPPAPLPPRSPAPQLFLAAPDIADPGNVGALTRTAHAAGAAGLLVAGASDPYHPRATRISRGSIFRLPIVGYETAAALLDDLRRCGVVAVATAAAGGTPLPAFDWPRGPAAVLMGNEAEGLPPEIAAAADHAVTIPMAPGVDSFSVNAAAAILLYVWQQQTEYDRRQARSG